jgi:5-methylcytosine-specific restriction endonuclease McrA
MSRSVNEWIGRTDDTPVPDRVRVRVFLAKGGKCHACGRKVNAAVEPWTCEHLIALINGGENRESNLDVTCCNCLPAKNAGDVAIKSKTAKMRKKTILKRKSKWRPMPGSRASGIRKRMNGDVERW